MYRLLKLVHSGNAGCDIRHLEPQPVATTKVGTGRPSRHPRPRGDGGDSCRRRLSYDEPDAVQA